MDGISDVTIERPVMLAGHGPFPRRRSAMFRAMRLTAVMTVVLTAAGEARAQYGYGYGYGYPYGYGV